MDERASIVGRSIYWQNYYYLQTAYIVPIHQLHCRDLTQRPYDFIIQMKVEGYS
jgi:hypothetical protein